MIKIFLDANILIDISYQNRPFSEDSGRLYGCFINNLDKYELYTSCDLFTTIYYVLRREFDNKSILEKLKILNKVMKVMEFGNDEIDEAIYLMERNEKFSDLEDTIQYVMARKERCDYIVTNDKGFVSHDIPLLSSLEALDELGLE
ncbi:MAG: PIN domain-containing protein [Campylobacterota bacterium]|nr:PIN domain-containing protein [Campylobacterota bacterium]